MGDDDLLDEGETEAGALLLRREERPEDVVDRVDGHAGAIVADADALDAVHGVTLTLDDNLRRDSRLIAGLERVATEVAERLTKQDLVAFDPAELAADDDVPAARPHVGPDFLGRALGEPGHLDGRQRELGRTSEVQEVGDDLSECYRFVPDALDVRTKVCRETVQIEQPAVSVDRGEAVAELVGDPGGHLPEAGQAVFQSELFLELHHFGEVAEQADDALRGAAGPFANG